MEKAQLRTLVKTGLRLARSFMYYSNFSPLPFRIQVDLTDRCNFLCPTCSKWKVKPGIEMSSSEWREIFMKLRNKTLTGRISFGGGEVTLREDLCDLIRYAKDAKLSVSMVTNGFLLTDEMLHEFEKAGLDSLVISLNGVNRDTHDPSRGIDGSFDRIMSILSRVDRFNLKINIETIILGTNIEEIIPLARMVKEKKLYGIHYQCFVDVGAHYALIKDKMSDVPDDWYEKNEFWIKDPARTAAVIRQLIDMQSNGYPILNPTDQLKKMIQYYTSPQSVKELKCLGGISTFYVDPYGEVRLCYGFESIGNIKDSKPLTLWNSSKAREIRRKTKKCDKMCRLLNNNY